MTQHADLSLERWQRFDRDRQVLMIANEMHRGSRATTSDGRERCYERVLRLTDLTIAAAHRPAFRRELLRWRDGVAVLYLEAREVGGQVDGGGATESSAGAATPDPRHVALLRCLLLFSVEAARQRPFVLG